jgi:hypothetical protein
MIHTDSIRSSILKRIARGLGWTGSDDDDISQEFIDKINELNAFQAIDNFLISHNVIGMTGDFIESVDELRAAEYSADAPPNDQSGG